MYIFFFIYIVSSFSTFNLLLCSRMSSPKTHIGLEIYRLIVISEKEGTKIPRYVIYV